MRKIVLADGAGWFDADAAKKFKSATYMTSSGQEMCLATREPGWWETLYLTAHGRFVLVRCHECCNPEDDSVFEIDEKKAAQWLLANGYQEELKKRDMRREEKELEL
jgi:hypothetical protein